MNIRQQALIVVPSVICVLACAFGVLGYFIGVAVGLPIRFSMPFWLRGLGTLVLIAGFVLLGWVFRYWKPGDVIASTYISMRRVFQGPRLDSIRSSEEPLILAGPYRLVRHPMYLAVVVLWLGWWLTLDYTFILFMAVFFFFWFNLVVIRFEEKEIKARYGDQYEAYARTVPRFFPFWMWRRH